MEDQRRKGNPWSMSEVQTFLCVLAEDRIQKELDGAMRNEKVFREVAQLMASHGYLRTSQQCRNKVKKLKSDYRQVKDHNNRSDKQKTWKWFDQMDAIYGHRPANQGKENGVDTATSLLEAIEHAAAEKQAGPSHSSQRTSPRSRKPFRGITRAVLSQTPTSSYPPGCYPRRSTPPLNVPLSSLRLCVPPLRLLSAIMWQVAEQHQVKYYTRVEEFVCVILEVLPDLLSARKRAELLLGLRAKFILELCRDAPSVNLQIMQPHLDRLCRNAKSASDMNEDPMVDAAVRDFVSLIQTILRSPQEKKHFFLEIYPLHYGPKYDSALQSMVWEFLHSLEKLLPVPSFHQVASWLDGDPLHLEDSLKIVPKEVQNLLQYVKNGLLDPGSSSSAINPNTILSTLSVSITWPCEQADTEKSVSLSSDTQPSVNEGDGQRAVDKNMDRWLMNDEDLGGDLDEEDILRCLNEDPQRDLDEKHLNQQKVEMTGTNGYTSNQESTSTSRSEKKAPKSTGSDTGGSSPNSSSPETISQRSDTAVSGPQSHPKENFHVSVAFGRNHLCKVCGFGFATLADLKQHQTVHPEMPTERPAAQRCHLCSYCGKTFKCQSTLESHTRVHTGERPFVCSVCGKGFTQQSILASHRRLHTGERPHLCSVCGKSFITSGALITHMRLHTGERPHKCEFCSKAFRMACHLTVHKRFHTKDRPYPCAVCDKRFSTSNLRTRHMRTHTGEKPYQCQLCEKRFSNATTMKIHQHVHR